MNDKYPDQSLIGDNPKCDEDQKCEPKKPCDAVLNYLEEYTSSTSLHGLQYIGDRSRNIIEKIWWIFMFTLSFFTCTYLIYQLYKKWDQSPVIVSFAESPTSIWQMPFPSITICPETKSLQRVFNYTDMHYNYENMSEEDKMKYEIVSLTCSNHVPKVGEKFINSKSLDILAEVGPNISYSFQTCLWQSMKKDCEELFTPVLTEEGICYSFNMLNAKELFQDGSYKDEYKYLNHKNFSTGWTLDNGYPDSASTNAYPRRGTGSGVLQSLSVVLRVYTDDLDYLCRGPVQGFKVSLHSPSEFPRVSEQFLRVPLNHEIIATIKPNMMTTSDGLKDYDPERRQCYFPGENPLEFFSTYSQHNCYLESLAMYTYYICDCIPYSLPKNDDIEICGTAKIECATAARVDLLRRKTEVYLNKDENPSEIDQLLNEIVVEDFRCLPSCTVIEYDVEISQSNYEWKKVYESYNETQEDVQLSRLMLFFKKNDFISSKRSELYGLNDFLANCGGLLGLCLGFSVLSLIELFYFLTLRIACNYINYRRAKKSATEKSK